MPLGGKSKCTVQFPHGRFAFFSQVNCLEGFLFGVFAPGFPQTHEPASQTKVPNRFQLCSSGLPIRIAFQECPSGLHFRIAFQECFSGSVPFQIAFQVCPSGLPFRIVFQDCPSDLAFKIVVWDCPSGLLVRIAFSTSFWKVSKGFRVGI